MMIKINNGEIEAYSVGRLRRDNPNTSFPKDITNATLASYNVYKVEVGDKPNYDEATQKAVFSDTTFDGTVASRTWSIENLNAAELSELSAEKSSLGRTKRDTLLAETDWTGMSDVTMASAMTTYRQALRDVPSQAGFPNSITWPTKP